MIYLIVDTHGAEIVLPADCLKLFHLGDFVEGKIRLPGTATRAVLIRGNHDKNLSECPFDFVCDGLLIDGFWFTHEPAFSLPLGAHFNIHGHLHGNVYEDYGYIRKPFHIELKPNTLYRIRDGKIEEVMA